MEVNDHIAGSTTLEEILQRVPSTVEVLYFYKMQGNDRQNEWISWAIEMLEAGYETEYLLILAGENTNCNSFEFAALVDRVLDDLHLDIEEFEIDYILMHYADYLVKQAILLSSHLIINLSRLSNLSWELHQKNIYEDFRYLHWAIVDLYDFGYQDCWYDSTLTKENSSQYVLDFFKQWLETPIESREFVGKNIRNRNNAEKAKKLSMRNVWGRLWYGKRN